MQIGHTSTIIRRQIILSYYYCMLRRPLSYKISISGDLLPPHIWQGYRQNTLIFQVSLLSYDIQQIPQLQLGGGGIGVNISQPSNYRFHRALKEWTYGAWLPKNGTDIDVMTTLVSAQNMLLLRCGVNSPANVVTVRYSSAIYCTLITFSSKMIPICVLLLLYYVRYVACTDV